MIIKPPAARRSARRWRSRRCTSASRSSRACRRGDLERQLVLRAPRSTATGSTIVGGHADDRAHGHERGGVRGPRRAAPLAGVPVRAHDALVERARSSSTSARSTGATATGSSPSSTGAQPPPGQRPGGTGVATAGQYQIQCSRRQQRRTLPRCTKFGSSGLDNSTFMCECSELVAKWYKPMSGAASHDPTGHREIRATRSASRCAWEYRP